MNWHILFVHNDRCFNYSQSSRKRPPREFKKVVATRSSRLQEWALVTDQMMKQQRVVAYVSISDNSNGVSQCAGRNWSWSLTRVVARRVSTVHGHRAIYFPVLSRKGYRSLGKSKARNMCLIFQLPTFGWAFSLREIPYSVLEQLIRCFEPSTV